MTSTISLSLWERAGLRVSALVAATLLLASCGGTAAPASPAARSAAAAPTKSPIKIGSLADTSSTFAVLGAETHVATDLVAGQINAAGGIDGHPLEVTYADPKSDPAQALQLATQLVQRDGVDVLMGANGSAECLGVAQLAPKLGVVYMPTAGCAADEFVTKNCNTNTFRVSLATTQSLNAETATLVSKYGKNWGVLYPDYAFGQSQLSSFQAALQPLGGQVKLPIATPLNETNLNPYISKIPTDGSIDGLLDAQGGADLVRGLQALQQFGVLKKVPIFLGSGGREFFGGVYPAAIDGVLLGGLEPSKAPASYPALQAFQKAYADQAAKEDKALMNILGGADKATPGVTLGYQAYLAMTALKNGMAQSHFAGKADTAKLIDALTNLKMPQGPDSPTGPFVMNPTDHQGKAPNFLMKVNVAQQGEDIVDVTPPDKIANVGSCHV